MSDVELPDSKELLEFKEKRFTKRIALVMALYAVMLAITSLGGNNAAKEMMLAQQQASNEWAFYQAKASREHQYRVQHMLVKALLLERGNTMNAAAKAMYEDLARTSSEEVQRFAGEKKGIEAKAKALERSRDINMSRDPLFDFAEVLLQIAIVLGSISILANSVPVFGMSLGAAGLGTLLMINGYLLLVRVPFLS
jgi:hypothetical protein